MVSNYLMSASAGLVFGGGLVLLAAGLASCGREPTLDAPDVRWGQDVCSECGMILSDDRYAAASVTIKDGERGVALYDDIGEMLEAVEIPGASNGTHRGWVRDAIERTWIDAATAVYVRSPDLHTPMGFGVAAYGDLADAEAARDEYQGELLYPQDY